MWQSVAEYAREQGVSPARIRQLASAGRIPARRSAGVWLVENSSPTAQRRMSRPLSARMSAGLIALLSGIPLPIALSSSEVARIRTYIERLRTRNGAEHLMASWLPQRAERVQLRAPKRNIIHLLTDPHFAPSGVSDARISVRSSILAEGYITSEVLPEIIKRYGMAPAKNINVVLHVTRLAMPNPVPLALSLVDLAEYEIADLGHAFEALLNTALEQADSSRKRMRIQRVIPPA